MYPTIDVIKSVDISGIPTATCNTSDGCIAVGDGNGQGFPAAGATLIARSTVERKS